jgi:DNA-binding GntR family transcriptional regulator
VKNKKIHPFIDIRPDTLSHSIYKYLKDSIQKNKIKANQKINETEIGDLFKVSRTPVREAIFQLAAEGFIEIDYHRGAMVKELSLKEVKDIYQVIANLDTLGMKLIDFENVDEKTIKKLELSLSKIESAFHKKDLDKYVDVNIEFHEQIWQYIPNFFLHEVLRMCIIQITRYIYLWNRFFEDPGNLKKTLDAHQEIIEALKNENRSKLKAIVSKHWIFPDSSFMSEDEFNIQ